MSDTLAKIRAEIEKLRTPVDSLSDLDLGYDMALRKALAIIDEQLAAERKPRAGWGYMGDGVWEIDNDEGTPILRVEVAPDGDFYYYIKDGEYWGDEGVGGSTLPAAQLAAEDAMEKMGGGE